jgi:DNA-binding NarL/FixJ family response regulator
MDQSKPLLPAIVQDAARRRVRRWDIFSEPRDSNQPTSSRRKPTSMLDVNLPNVHSLEACREITRVSPTTKVIVFTAMNDAAASQAFFEAGASAFVSKAEAGDLLSTIKRLCTDRG